MPAGGSDTIKDLLSNSPAKNKKWERKRKQECQNINNSGNEIRLHRVHDIILILCLLENFLNKIYFENGHAAERVMTGRG